MSDLQQQILGSIANAKKVLRIRSRNAMRWGTPKPEPYAEEWRWDENHLSAEIYFSYAKRRLLSKIILNGEVITQKQLKVVLAA